MKTCRAIPSHPVRPVPSGTRTMLAATMAILLSCISSPGISQRLFVPPPGRINWKLLKVKIIARGSTATDAAGDMDAYLALISQKRGGDQTAVRLVHYHPSFETKRRDELIVSGRTIRLRLSSASYCNMPAKDFVVEGIFDPDALKAIREASDHDSLPCFIVRE